MRHNGANLVPGKLDTQGLHSCVVVQALGKSVEGCKIGSLDIFLTKLCVKATEENYTSTRSILLGPINMVPITVAKVAKIASGEIGQRPISSLCHGLCQTRPLKILLNTRVDYALTEDPSDKTFISTGTTRILDIATVP